MKHTPRFDTDIPGICIDMLLFIGRSAERDRERVARIEIETPQERVAYEKLQNRGLVSHFAGEGPITLCRLTERGKPIYEEVAVQYSSFLREFEREHF